MDTLDYWTPADALAFRCSVEQVGTLKPAPVSGAPGQDLSDLARAYAPRALRALARIAESSDSRAGVDAARLLLELAYPPAPAAPSAPAPLDEPPAPDYLTGQRLAYQNQPRQCLPEQHQPRQCLPRQSLTSD